MSLDYRSDVSSMPFLNRALFDLSVALDKEDELFGELEHDIDIEISDLTVLLQLLERVVEFSVKKQNVSHRAFTTTESTGIINFVPY